MEERAKEVAPPNQALCITPDELSWLTLLLRWLLLRLFVEAAGFLAGRRSSGRALPGP